MHTMKKKIFRKYRSIGIGIGTVARTLDTYFLRVKGNGDLIFSIGIV